MASPIEMRGPVSNSASNAQERTSARNFAAGSKVDRVRVADPRVAAGNGRAAVRERASGRVAGRASRNGQAEAEVASSGQEAACNNDRPEAPAIVPLALSAG
jgi:hypothetical protein